MIRNNSILLTLLIYTFFQVNVLAQKNIVRTLKWSQNTENLENPTFDKAHYYDESGIPYFVDQFQIQSFGDIQFNIVDYQSEPISFTSETKIDLPSIPVIKSNIIQERRNYFATFSFSPLIKNSSTGAVEKITRIELSYNFQPKAPLAKREGPEFKTTSVLRDGDIYKVAVSKSGVYKITSSDLSSFGINPSDINPKNIQIFGNPGGMNPEANEAFRYDDLVENAIFIQGEEDGSFDSGDFILFYAHGPHSYQNFEYSHNIYDDNNYYFIKIGASEGLRISERENITVGEYASTYDAYRRYEKDEYNLLADFTATQGSGKMWFSDKLRPSQSLDLSAFFMDPMLDLNEEVTFEIQAAGRSSTSSRISLNIEGSKNFIQFNGVSTSRIESTYADLEKKVFALSLEKIDPTVTISYENAAGDAEAWIDYLFMEYQAKLSFDKDPIVFKSREDIATELFGYEIEKFESKLMLWDITDPEKIKKQSVENGRFGYTSSGQHEFVLFDPTSVESKVVFISEIENQNLHELSKADLVIIYHPDFLEAAERLARHRADHSDLNTVIASVDQIYNEFSSGRVDVPAIRNFARMLYLRDPSFKYLALIGDGTYDYKYRDVNNANDNFVPVFETSNSLHSINAFPTDDFYALLDEREGDNLVGGLDIAVGRIPARTLAEANVVVDKIISYDTDVESLDDWRLRLGFVADDEDANIHLRDSDLIAEKSRKKYENFNIEKIFFDAFPQVATPGGERYPQATEALYNNLFKGMLTLCYLGHGGPKGWAQERVLKREDVAGWNNNRKLPLFVTATCSFTGFDNPAEVSAGETVLFEKNGGAIGLMSTVRAVYVSRNKVLTEAVFDTIFTKAEGEFMGIGEILRRAKNSNAGDTTDVNARKFLLVGDPSLKLAIPKLNIVTTSLNGVPIDENYLTDTINALQKMQFDGYIQGEDGNVMESFNGVVIASVFDKLIKSETLSNNASSPKATYNIQKTVLFKGQAEVINGKFSFDFYLPADINFEYGNGKISLYAKSGNLDASGQFRDFIIGGSNEGLSDDSPPQVEVFLNDEDFVFGGISNTEPILLVKLSDDYGINVAGVSVGHDLVAVLDNNSKESYILNDFYEADINDSRSGTVRFPLKDIEPGKHTISIKAWDLSNNPGEGYTEFIVVDEENSGLEHVLNYPNPFSTRTLFQFEHNLPGTELDIIIHIYNMSGQIVKTIEHVTVDDGFRIDDIEWDGMDDYGEKIANGVYLYKINVHAKLLDIKKESNYEKLVILK